MHEIFFPIHNETLSANPSAFSKTKEITMNEYSSSQCGKTSFYAPSEQSLKRIALSSITLFDNMDCESSETSSQLLRNSTQATSKKETRSFLEPWN